MQAVFIKFLSVLCISLASLLALADESPVIAIIVSSDTQIAPHRSIAPNELNLIYWRKKQYLEGGQRIHPANLHAENPLRVTFSKVVLDSLPKDQTDYWNGMYFHGVSPPRSLLTEEAVIRYVAETTGSIGYINACNVDSRVKPILWIHDNHIQNNVPDNIHCNASEANNH
jgi:hypothetical protein